MCLRKSKVQIDFLAYVIQYIHVFIRDWFDVHVNVDELVIAVVKKKNVQMWISMSWKTRNHEVMIKVVDLFCVEFASYKKILPTWELLHYGKIDTKRAKWSSVGLVNLTNYEVNQVHVLR